MPLLFLICSPSAGIHYDFMDVFSLIGYIQFSIVRLFFFFRNDDVYVVYFGKLQKNCCFTLVVVNGREGRFQYPFSNGF
jgi:hypothetical protein